MTDQPNKDWVRILLIQCAVSLTLTGVVWFLLGLQQGASMAAGSAIMTVNIGLLGWSWTRILNKKSIALASSTIVIKYAFFVTMLVWLSAQSWVQGLWLMAGVVTFMPTTLISVLRGNSERSDAGHSGNNNGMEA